MSKKYPGDVTEMDLNNWRLDATMCQAVNSEMALKCTSPNDDRLLHILNRNSRFCIKVPDRFLSHNCTPAWRLQNSGKVFQPTILRNTTRPKNTNLRKRMKHTSGIKAPEPDPVSYSIGLMHNGKVADSDTQGFDPVCQSAHPLNSCPNSERHTHLLQTCPLALACPSCWSGQRRGCAKNPFGEFYKELQRKLIEKGNAGSYMEYRMLHRYGKIWKKSINAGTTEFRRLLKGLEARERNKMEEKESNRKGVKVMANPFACHPVQSSEVVKIETDGENVDVCVDESQEGNAEKSFCERFFDRLPEKQRCDVRVMDIAMHRKHVSS